MKIEKINENQVKIFVSSRDLQDREISISDLWSNGPKVRKLFWEMMEKANYEVGFDLEGKPMLVEAYGMPPEGFFVIITKGEDGQNISEYLSEKWINDFNQQDESMDDGEEEISDEEMDSYVGDPLNIIFSFENFDSVCAGVKRISGIVENHVSLYKWEFGYCLVVGSEKLDDDTIDKIETVLSEFGDEQLFTEDFLIEHGRIVVEDSFISVFEEYLK